MRSINGFKLLNLFTYLFILLAFFLNGFFNGFLKPLGVKIVLSAPISLKLNGVIIALRLIINPIVIELGTNLFIIIYFYKRGSKTLLIWINP